MNDIEIVGNGNIGDKARQLVEKTPKLKHSVDWISILVHTIYNEFMID